MEGIFKLRRLSMKAWLSSTVCITGKTNAIHRNTEAAGNSSVWLWIKGANVWEVATVAQSEA